MLCNAAAFAQDSLDINLHVPGKIDSILVTGCVITDPAIVYKEFTFNPGDYVDSALADYNRERVYSLGIFSMVHYHAYHKGTAAIIEYNVKESWYIWPIPFAEFKNKDWKRLSYGMDIQWNNFRGLNEVLKFRFGLGYDPELKYEYRIPYLFRKQEINLNLNGGYSKSTSKSVAAKQVFGSEFTQQNISAGFTLGKRFNTWHRASLSASFGYVASPEIIPGANLDTASRIDRNISVGLGYVYDTRDLAQYASTGEYISLASYRNFSTSDAALAYNVTAVDFRSYFSLARNVVVKFRLAARNLYGDVIPAYDLAYLGYADRVRGHLNDKREGTDLYLFSAELKYPVFEDLDLEFDFPVIPRSLQSFRTAVFITAFMDAGSVRNRVSPLQAFSTDRGYGFGITVLVLPYNIARFEFAVNEKGNGEIILDLGTSF